MRFYLFEEYFQAICVCVCVCAEIRLLCTWWRPEVLTVHTLRSSGHCWRPARGSTSRTAVSRRLFTRPYWPGHVTTSRLCWRAGLTLTTSTTWVTRPYTSLLNVRKTSGKGCRMQGGNFYSPKFWAARKCSCQMQNLSLKNINLAGHLGAELKF